MKKVALIILDFVMYASVVYCGYFLAKRIGEPYVAICFVILVLIFAVSRWK